MQMKESFFSDFACDKLITCHIICWPSILLSSTLFDRVFHNNFQQAEKDSVSPLIAWFMNAGCKPWAVCKGQSGVAVWSNQGSTREWLDSLSGRCIHHWRASSECVLRERCFWKSSGHEDCGSTSKGDRADNGGQSEENTRQFQGPWDPRMG